MNILVIVLMVISAILLVLSFTKGQNSIWGGATVGIVVGLIVGLVIGELPNGLMLGFSLGAIIGFALDVVG